MPDRRAIAFFDLDKTVLVHNSGIAWLRFEVREGRLGMLDALLALRWAVLYMLGFAALEDAIRRGIATLTGETEVEIRARAARFFEGWVQGRYRPGATRMIEQHRAAGDRLVLLTSSSAYVSESVAKELGFDHYLANRFELDGSGLYTGRPIEPLCYGSGKVVLARAHAAIEHVPLKDCSFYSDSASDLPMLEAVGRPVAVNPDPRLRRLARKRGWEIVDWGR